MIEKVETITVVLVTGGGSSFAEGDILVDGKRLPCARIELNIQPTLWDKDDHVTKHGEILTLHIPLWHVDIQTRPASEEGS